MNTREQEEHLRELRRNQVYELHAKGYSNTEISNMLSEHVSEPTVSRDIAHLKRQARENIRNFIDKELPHEYQKTLIGLTCIMNEAWTEARNSTGRNRMQALELASRAYQMRLELLTNSTVVEDSVKFIEDIKKKKDVKGESNAVETEAFDDCEAIEQELEQEQEQELKEE